MNKVFAFEVSVVDAPWPPSIVNHISAGKAKAEYWRDVTDCWPDIPYTALRCRKVGSPQTSYLFIRNAKYRGMPDIRCGQRVKVGASIGTIVGHNSSANFNVLFDADAPHFAGLKLNVHPGDIELLEENL